MFSIVGVTSQSLALIMAGTGELETFQLLRKLRFFLYNINIINYIQNINKISDGLLIQISATETTWR